MIMSAKVEMVYKLNGDFKEGIEIEVLAPALLNLSKLINAAYREINPDRPDLGIHVKPFGRGSFVVDLLIFTENQFEHVLDLIRSKRGQEVKEVLEYLGLITTVTGGSLVSLFGVVRLLGGKAKTVERVEPGEFKYTGENGASVTVKKEVHAIIQNPEVHDTLYPSVGKTLDIPNATGIESYLKRNKAKTLVLTDKEAASAIRNYAESPVPLEEDVTIVESPRILWLHPKRISVEGESSQWSFRAGSDGEIITANVLDVGFLQRVANGTHRLTHSDLIHAEMIEKQTVAGTKILSKTTDLIRVKEYRRAPDQADLWEITPPPTPGKEASEQKPTS